MLEYRAKNYVEGKVIVITGAYAGFGEATARKAAAMGGKVVLAARRAEKLEKIVEEIRAAGGDAVACPTDVQIQEQCQNMVKFAIDTYGHIDVLVNDAGTMPQAFFSEANWVMPDWERCIDTAIKGALYCTCAVYDHMMKNGRGHIVNVSSILGNLAVNGNGVYNVSKVGARYLAESLRAECRGRIKTTVVRPTSVSTTELGLTTVNANAAMAGMYGKLFQAFSKNESVYPEIKNRDSIQYGGLLPMIWPTISFMPSISPGASISAILQSVPPTRACMFKCREGEKDEGKKMVVIGGGITGMEAALFLRAQGNEVSVVDMLPEWPTDMQGGDPRFMMEASLETKHCYENHIGMYYNNRVLDFADGMLNLESTADGTKTALPADIIVLSTGVKPNDQLFNDLRAAGHPSVWKVGDANHTDKIYKAVMNGSKFAVNLK